MLLTLVFAPALGGCVAVTAAAAVTSATVGAVTAVGRGVNRAATAASNAVVRTVSRIPAAVMSRSAPRRVVIPARPTSTARRVPPGSRRPEPVTAKSTPAQKRAQRKKTSKQRDEILEVLPPELLDQLSTDQLILQSMIQTDALEGPGRETVFWDLDGRAGTAFAEEPHRVGGFTCRIIIETLQMAETDTEAIEARATACRTDTTGWTLSF